MPLYEYECEACGHRFERIQKFSDPPVTKCPTCDGVVRKLLSSPAIQFKGSGWYITDYARKGGDVAKGEGAKADAAKADGAGKSEAQKPAEKPSGSSSTTNSAGTASE